ncbi:MAG TPA: VOC family protein [Vicinamibacterales bacterium]|nr:VOC family protein [Vicinamibacterales bacterium]
MRHPAVSCLLAAAFAAGSAGAGADDASSAATRDRAIYGHVASLGWIVRDVDAVASAWRRLGVTAISGPEDVVLKGTHKNRAVHLRVRCATASFPNAHVKWIQPLEGESEFDTFLRTHGDGVHHLTFRVPDTARLEAEIATYRAAGVDVVQRLTWMTPGGPSEVVYLDTARDGGGIAIALESGGDRSWPASAQNAPPFGPVTQYAILVRDVRSVSRFYERLGFAPIEVERNVSLDRRYRGRPAGFEMFLGWGRWSDVVFEWIEPIVGPSIYDEQLERAGEGFHHLAFNVPDMDEAVALLESKGLTVTMSGGWDSNGHQGRFAYLDAERHGGVAIELLWNKPRARNR